MSNGAQGPGQPPGTPPNPSNQSGAPQASPLYQQPAFQQTLTPPTSEMSAPPESNLSGGGSKAKRKVKNYLLQPLLQVKIGMYSIILSVAFAIALAAILYFNFIELVDSIVAMTDAEEEVRDIFRSYWRGAQIYIYLAFFVYLAATIGASVLYTHKLVGPTIAFRRHIRSIIQGNYYVRTYLRKGDAFLEVADELNHLSEIMERATTTGAPHPGQFRAAAAEPGRGSTPPRSTGG